MPLSPMMFTSTIPCCISNGYTYARPSPIPARKLTNKVHTRLRELIRRKTIRARAILGIVAHGSTSRRSSRGLSCSRYGGQLVIAKLEAGTPTRHLSTPDDRSVIVSMRKPSFVIPQIRLRACKRNNLFLTLYCLIYCCHELDST